MWTSDLRTVWLVRWRSIQVDVGFWLILVGYDTRKRSFTNRIYTLYALAFFALWIFMVLTLLADVAARFLQTLPFATPQAAAAGAGALGLVGLFLFELYQALQRSPFRFSEVDALWLCQTPVDRRPVALIWLFNGWVKRGLFVWSAAVVLGYALLQAQFPREMTPGDLPVFLLAGARMFSVVVPLDLAALGLAWAAGAWRLRGQTTAGRLRWIAPGLALLFAAVAALAGLPALAVALAPVVYLVQAGLGLAPWLVGFALALLAGLGGLFILWLASPGMSLARAAQESTGRDARQAAALATPRAALDRHEPTNPVLPTPGNPAAGTPAVGIPAAGTPAAGLRAAGSPVRPLPNALGWRSLPWKSTREAGRAFRLTDLFPWLVIASLVLSLAALPGWGARVWSVAVWLLVAGQQADGPLRMELSRWWLFRQLPFRSEDRIAGVLALPVFGIYLAGLVGLAAALVMRVPVPGIAVVVYLATAPAVALCVAIDLFRQAKTQDLLAGRIPDLTLWGWLMGLLALALNGGLAWFLWAQLSLPPAMAYGLSILECLTVLWLLRQIAGDLLRDLKN